MAYNPFDDPDFTSPSPSRRRRDGLLQGLMGHVSPEVHAHLQDISQVARQVGGSAVDRAIDFAADNPDKMEQIGGRVGMAAGAGMVSPIIGGRAGKKAGSRLGGLLSRKARERRGGGMPEAPSQSSTTSSDWDPFGDNTPSTTPSSLDYDPFKDG